MSVFAVAHLHEEGHSDQFPVADPEPTLPQRGLQRLCGEGSALLCCPYHQQEVSKHSTVFSETSWLVLVGVGES